MAEILKKSNIILNLPNESRNAVIDRCGQMLLKDGYINEKYIEGMHKRDQDFPIAIGNFIAIPHGAKEYRDQVKSTGLVVLTYPQGIQWGEEVVKLVIGIAALGDEHIWVLEKMAEQFEYASEVEKVVMQGDIDVLTKIFNAAD